MTEIEVCLECGHINKCSKPIKVGDKLWWHGVHYIIATVDYDIDKQKVGIQLIDPDNGTRTAQHPVYVKNINDITEQELSHLV